MLEYSRDKILLTATTNILLIVHDFSLVKFINNQSYIDQFKSPPVPLLDFDIENFPFMLFGGISGISIINVKTGEHRPLLNDSVIFEYQGMKCLFVKREEYGQSIHWVCN